ncbi:protein PBDC1-like [Varanus komodoensis]|uniref:protein PBDC1-like n=1 Tax=Varanus komodoensis TaxID=61221 RepID=UPI001CF767DA|nr:protein PBDC1-like [Varanus komodoensis]
MHFSGVKIDSFFRRKVSWADETGNFYQFVALMTMMEDLLSQGAQGASAAALSLLAEAFRNDPLVEVAWAAKAYQSAQVYFNLISSIDPEFLKLTKVDDQFYSEFWKDFPDLQIGVLDPEDLKSGPAKKKWHPFCLWVDEVVEDFNYILWMDCRKGCTEENTIFATRIQFFSIEIACNREGYNHLLYDRAREACLGTQVNSSG